MQHDSGNSWRFALKFEPADYGSTCAQLLSECLPLELGPGTPRPSAAIGLRQLSPADLFSGQVLCDETAARCCLAGLWLRCDFLDESHTISQQIDTREGSYWHAIMHRRERDFSNSKYWYRRVGDHPIFADLGSGAEELLRSQNTDGQRTIQFAAAGLWDPYGFVDLCSTVSSERHREHRAIREFCGAMAELEWWLLFDYCFGMAIGRAGLPR